MCSVPSTLQVTVLQQKISGGTACTVLQQKRHALRWFNVLLFSSVGSLPAMVVLALELLLTPLLLAVLPQHDLLMAQFAPSWLLDWEAKKEKQVGNQSGLSLHLRVLIASCFAVVGPELRGSLLSVAADPCTTMHSNDRLQCCCQLPT
jgi:hypothetical protein